MTKVYLLLLTALLMGTAMAAETAAPAKRTLHGASECMTCHSVLESDNLRKPAELTAGDVHAKAGVGCAECHGGDPRASDPTKAHSASQGFVASPDPRDIPGICAQCHSNHEYMRGENPSLPTDQYDKYWTSKHGQLLKMGLRKVAQCSSCHTAHDVRPANDPNSTVYPVNVPGTCAKCHSDRDYMRGFTIPTDQYAKYAASVHGLALLGREDLGAPACNDCHGNHGAFPPGVDSLAHVCGTCHSLNMMEFEKSPHAAAFASEGIGQCSACHSHHAIGTPDPGAFAMTVDSACIDCHEKDDPGWKWGVEMHSLAQLAINERAEVKQRVQEAQRLGMDVTEAEFMLTDSRTSLLQLRTISHSLDREAFEEKVEEALAQTRGAGLTATLAVEEFHFRRKGLLIAMLLSLPVVLLMWLKIREIGLPGET